MLRRELRAPSWRRELVAVGTATDPYQPAEVRYLLTRKALEALLEAANPFSITTKSTLVTRDLDLLGDAAGLTRCTVYFSVSTLDETVWKQIEPGTPHPRKRLEAMARLAAAGVRAGVLMAPILPGLTDRDELMEELVAQATAHGAHFLSPIPLRLMEGARECYLDALAEHYPDLRGPTLAMYRSVNAPASYRTALERRVDALRERYGLVRREDPASYPAPDPAMAGEPTAAELAGGTAPAFAAINEPSRPDNPASPGCPTEDPQSEIVVLPHHPLRPVRRQATARQITLGI